MWAAFGVSHEPAVYKERHGRVPWGDVLSNGEAEGDDTGEGEEA